MRNLTESAIVARNAIKYGAIGFVGITLLWYMGVALVNLYKHYFPAAPPPPLSGFGEVAKIKFPQENGRPNVSLELPTGDIPSFPDRMVVYHSPLRRSSFLNANQAVDQAAKLGFTFKPTEKSKIEYVWDNQDQLGSRMTMNIVTGHFELTRQWQNNPGLSKIVNFKSDTQVLTAAVGFLRKADILPEDILGEERIGYLRADSGKLAPALSLSDADFVQIDFYRKNVEEIDLETKEITASYPFYRPNPQKGLIRLVLSGGEDMGERLILFDNNYHVIDYTRSSTYPIKTGIQAWEELESGGGYVTDESPDTGIIKIRRMFLGYFDGGVDEHTQPVYVFLGDKNFVAYVTAITDEWLK
jgi:hypothetical protein